MGLGHRPVFTYCGLGSLNILVRGDDVVDIVDWESAGWYPSYGGYTTACQVNSRNYSWRAHIDGFLDPMLDELSMDQTHLLHFGDV